MVHETQRAGCRIAVERISSADRRKKGSWFHLFLRKNANAYLYYRREGGGGGQEHVEFERRIDSRKESYDGTFRSYVSFPPDARGHSDQRFHPGTTPFSNRFVRAWEEEQEGMDKR